jgi:solute carrier family 25 phosphate transporter 23/24/25/41
VFETAKSVLAELTQSEDKNAIPVGARFIAGGVAGLCSQFCIYPVETLKTRIMSTNVGSSATGAATAAAAEKKKSIVLSTAKQMYKGQGIRAFWPGLTLGLMGVFPYQALDMGIYETLKVTYLQYMKNQPTTATANGSGPPQPNIMVLWSCGMVSGCIGASSVYPLNMIRTR